MKQTKCILAVCLVLIVGIFAYRNTQILRGTDALLEEGREVFPLVEGTADSLSYAGLIENDDEVLVWFTSDNGYGGHDYWAMHCKITGRDAYRFMDWNRPKTYAKDIVSTLWNGDSIFLINNESCTSVANTDENGALIVEDSIREGAYPYIYTLRDLSGKTTFLNSDGDALF